MARSRQAPSAEPPSALEDYARKRDFRATPEPGAQGAQALPNGSLRFVIQKHWATRLHYDLRLEIGGTMKSWAVPKGPSFDPADKRMAVQVEDHPIAYNQFEGQIPAKQYGAGRVIIWDKGYWVPLEDPAQAYHAGKLKFEIHGHKLRGRWTLVRMHGRGNERQPPWLLIKERDGQDLPAAEYSVVDAMPDSVKALPDLPLPASPGAGAEPAQPPAPRAVSGKAARARPGGLQRQRAESAPMPQALSPQLATLVDGPPGNLADWLFELKFDGYRILARIEGGQVRLITRNGNDWTHRMPQLAAAVAALPVDSGWIDGEIVVLDRHGIPDFQALQNAFESSRGVRGRRAAASAAGSAGAEVGGLVFYAFDLPYFNGHDLRGLPLHERRDALRTLVAAGEGETVRFSEAFEAAPDQLIASACQLGFEGVIGKRTSATYVEGRSAEWIKLKCGQRQEFVIGGYTDPQGARTGIGSLLLGVHGDDGLLHYVGNVGSGFSERTLKTLHEQLKALGAPRSPFAEGTQVGRKAHWVEPRLLAEVAFAGWTHTRHIRHAVFRGLREDKPPQDIVQETPVSADAIAAAPSFAPPAHTRMTARKKPSSAATWPPAKPAKPPAGRSRRAAAPGPSPSLRVTNAERVIDADSGLTKLDLVRYYALVAPLMMEHLRQRPVSVVRAPEGVGHELFFQRHQEQGTVEGIRLLDTALYPDHPALMEVAAPEGLPASAQMNAIEFHTWNARSDRIARPDRMTFDLDPGEGVGWEKIQEATTLMRVMLTELGLSAFLKTSGGKGLHVVVPIKRLHGWDTVKGFSQAVVQHMARTIPHLFVAKSGPRNRVGKIFVDYLRNGFGATTVCAWSARARPGLGISVPLAWNELETLSGSAQWTVRSVDDRLREGNAPWDGYASAAVSITRAMRLLEYEPPRG
ncbi:DNA ligase D [Acidovorax sp. NCPPB 4044]|uniref:DNA ligase D n=1 Tax=Acidovorax sp. NCPPB 4044 TaxID=2940490 RepID=UPI0023031BB0|nr:DNA ligase D [Acidovorax sp. NCPPB 4044]MDA8521042.1 DNA ligase D [Acidovorax sp. NCPPB 4044]